MLNILFLLFKYSIINTHLLLLNLIINLHYLPPHFTHHLIALLHHHITITITIAFQLWDKLLLLQVVFHSHTNHRTFLILHLLLPPLLLHNHRFNPIDYHLSYYFQLLLHTSPPHHYLSHYLHCYLRFDNAIILMFTFMVLFLHRMVIINDVITIITNYFL